MSEYFFAGLNDGGPSIELSVKNNVNLFKLWTRLFLKQQFSLNEQIRYIQSYQYYDT